METLKYTIIPLVISFFATASTIKLLKTLGIVDDPQKNKHPKVIHTYPVPRGGGLPIYLSVLISSLIFLPFDYHLRLIIFGASLIVIIGLADDLYDLNPYLRILLQTTAMLIPTLGGIGINFITNPFGGIFNLDKTIISINTPWLETEIKPLVVIFTIFWVFFIMNMINMGAKGVDGQLPGVISIAATTIAIFSLKYSAEITEWPTIILALITTGAYLGFLPWNFYPQKIMPGYSGSTLGGYMLATLSILSTAKVGTLIVILGIPIIDTAFVIIRRMARGQSPVWGDRTHLHHKLLDKGWTKAKIAVFYWTASLILGSISLFINSTTRIYTIIGIALVVIGLRIWAKQNNNASSD